MAQKKTTDSDVIKEGEIIVKTCTRGCYQYVLSTEDNIYFPINLAEEYKIRQPIKVRYSAKVLETTTDIKKPAPTDQPIYDFTCTNVELTFIEKIE